MQETRKIAASMLAFAWVGGAAAQQPSASSPDELAKTADAAATTGSEEVVVTAQRRARQRLCEYSGHAERRGQPRRGVPAFRGLLTAVPEPS